MQTAPDEREIMLRAAVAKCFRYGKPVNVANVKAHLPADFFQDFDTGAPLDDATAFAELSAAILIAGRASGAEEPAPFPGHLPPSDNIAAPAVPGEHVEPDKIAAPVVEEATARHGASGPGPSPMERLNAARVIESDLIGRVASLKNAQRAAQEAVTLAEQEHAAHDPNRMTPAELSADYRKSSLAERKARIEREGTGQPRIAYVDQERKYSRGTDANAFARRQNVTGNKRGAMSLVNAMHISGSGIIDKAGTATRGPVPAPAPVVKPTIPALAK